MRRRLMAAIVLMAAVVTATPFAQPSGRHFLWKVEGPNGAVAHLMGSIHILTPDVYPLAPAIERAFAGSRTLVEELDLDELGDPALMMGALAKAMLTDGRTLDQLVDAATFAEVKRRAETSGLPMAALQRMKPWLAAITLLAPTLQSAGFRPELGVDRHFFDRAKAAGLPRVALETVAYQLDRFDQLPPALQAQMLKATLEELDTQVEQVGELVRLWSAGDARGLEVLLLGALLESPELYERLLVERNRNWIPTVDTCLTKNQGCFIVVGAAHLVGPHGLPALLEKQGYTVTQQ